MFISKHIFDDFDGDIQSEQLQPNQTEDSVSKTNNTSDRKSKMKDMLAEQRALAAKKQEARKAAMAGVQSVKMTGTDLNSIKGPTHNPNRITKKQSSSTADEMTEDGKIRSSEGSNSSAEAIEPIFDPTASAEHDILRPDPAVLTPSGELDLTDMGRFLNSPAPIPLQCYIVRQRGGLKNRLYPKYELYLKDGDAFVLAAKKRTKNKSSNYLISKDTNDLNKNSPNFVGKLRSNFIGTEFVIYDNGLKSKEQVTLDSRPAAGSASKDMRRELGCVFYQSNILGSRGPRKMTVLLPTTTNTDSKISLLETFKNGEHLSSSDIICLENKPPKWSDQVGAYVLNFNGRVTMASVKNFQLIQTGSEATLPTPTSQDSVVIMQFGRVAKDNFTMDFRAPLTPLQAFAIALSSFDYKIACE